VSRAKDYLCAREPSCNPAQGRRHWSVNMKKSDVMSPQDSQYSPDTSQMAQREEGTLNPDRNEGDSHICQGFGCWARVRCGRDVVARILEENELGEQQVLDCEVDGRKVQHHWSAAREGGTASWGRIVGRLDGRGTSRATFVRFFCAHPSPNSTSFLDPGPPLLSSTR
jgi:hypothetical protein